MNTAEQASKPHLRDILADLAAKYNGTLTPDVVVEHAEPSESPLHGYFEWDDTKAAAEFRLAQAAGLIRRVRVTYEVGENKTLNVRAFHNVRPAASKSEEEDDGRRGIYVPVETAMTTPSYRDQLFQSAQRDAKAFRSKYSSLQEASAIIGAIEQTFPE